MPEIQRRRRLLILTRFIGLVLVAAVTVGVFVAVQYGSTPISWQPNVKQLFAEAETWWTHGTMALETLAKVRHKYERVIQAGPGTPAAQKALLRLAQVEQKAGDSRKAFEYLYRLINRYPESTLAAHARYMVGRLWEREVGDLDQALVSYDIVINTYLSELDGPSGEAGNGTRRVMGSHVLRAPVLAALIASTSVLVEQGQYEAAVDRLVLTRKKFPDATVNEMLVMWEADLRSDFLGDSRGAMGLWLEIEKNRAGSGWGALAQRRRLDAVR